MLTTRAVRGILNGTSDSESRTSVIAFVAASRAGVWLAIVPTLARTSSTFT